MFLCAKCLSNYKDNLLERGECPICGNKELKHFDFYADYYDFEDPFKEEMCDIYQRIIEAPHNMKFKDSVQEYIDYVKTQYNERFFAKFLDQYHREFKKVIFNILLVHFFELLASDKIIDEDRYLNAVLDNDHLQGLVIDEWSLKDLISIFDIIGGVGSVEELLKEDK